MSTWSPNLAIAAIGVLAVVSTGCRGTTSKETPIFGIRNMFDQPKYDVQEESDFFTDHRTMRPLVEGVVSRDEEVNPEIAQGRLEDGSGYVLEIPREVVMHAGGMTALEERGRARYGIYCAPCHDGTGSGNGIVKKRAQATGAAAFAPPTFHQDRLRHAPDGQIFATISNGKNNMPPYGMQIAVPDRWAIVSYVRALQIASPKMEGAAEAPPTPTPAPGGTTTLTTADAGATETATDAGKAAVMADAGPKAAAKKDGGTP